MRPKLKLDSSVEVHPGAQMQIVGITRNSYVWIGDDLVGHFATVPYVKLRDFILTNERRVARAKAKR